MARNRALITPRARQTLKRGLLRLPRGRRKGRTVILCYHSIRPTRRLASATPELFDQHISWLKERCDLVPVREVLRRASEADRTRPAVAITFDDGYEDNHTWAFPIIERHRVHATFFVTTGFINRDEAVLDRFEQLRGLSRAELEPLSWTQITEMSEGGMAFGAHSASHANFGRLGYAAAVEELRLPKECLEDRLGQTIDLIAWPFGKPRIHFNHTTIDLARRAGYAFGSAICFRGVRPIDEPLALPRFLVNGDSIEMLEAKISGRLDPISLWQEYAPLWLTRRLSPEDTRV